MRSDAQRHPSLDERFDPAVRIVEYDPSWAAMAAEEVFAPDPEFPEFHFFGKPAERPRSYHLHVCVTGSQDEIRHLALRDFLRFHPDEAARYAALKREVAARHPRDRFAYIEGKAAYVAALELRAVARAR